MTLHQLEQLRGEMREHVHGIRGHVRILANALAMTGTLPLLVGSFISKRPQIRVDLREGISGEIVRAVSESRTDIGIVAAHECAEGLRLLPFAKNRLVLVIARNHPLARFSCFSFEDTLHYEYIGMTESSAVQRLLTNVANGARKSLKIRIHVDSFETACRMIAANAGIGVLPENFVRDHAKIIKVQMVPLTDPWAVRDLYICTRPVETLSRVVEELVHQLTTVEIDEVRQGRAKVR